jgi:hypothetical protein
MQFTTVELSLGDDVLQPRLKMTGNYVTLLLLRGMFPAVVVQALPTSPTEGKFSQQ